MGRNARPRPGSGLSRSGAPRCATGARQARRKESASACRSCRKGRGGPIARQDDATGRHPPKGSKPVRQRQLVDHTRSIWRVSIRRACRALPVERSTYHYRSRRAGQAELSERIKAIAATRVRYGYRRIQFLLRPEGWLVTAKRAYRHNREIGLQLRNKTPKLAGKRSAPWSNDRGRLRLLEHAVLRQIGSTTA